MYWKALTALFLCLSCNVEASEYVFGKSKSNSVQFEATGNPGFIRISGTGAKVEGMVKGDTKGFSADLTVDLNALKTGIELRDSHLKQKYLETTKYPKARLQIERLQPFKEGEEFFWTGKLTLKGSTKPVSGKATVKGKNVKANFKVLISDYPLEVPSWMGVSVAESVEVIVDATAL